MSKGFHATKVYKDKAPNSKLMEDLTKLILDYNLKCFVFKYDKERLYESTKKHLVNINFEESHRFKNQEFQALFYFIQVLDLYFDEKFNEINTQLRIYFDRGIYGVKDIEEFDVNSDKIETITFCSKKNIDLLGLPDHFGYIFRKNRIKYNEESNLRDLSQLQINESNTNLMNNCISSLSLIFYNGLFEFLDIDHWFEKIEN